MIRILFSLSLLTFSLSIFSQDYLIDKDSRDWLNLKGDVRSIRQTKFSLDSDGKEKPRKTNVRRIGDVLFALYSENFILDNSMIKFSEDGEIIEWLEYNEYGSVTDTLNVQYDSKSLTPNRILNTRRGDTLFLISYTYDKKLRRINTQYQDSYRLLTADYSYPKNENYVVNEFHQESDTTYLNFVKLSSDTYLSVFIDSPGDTMRVDTMIFNNNFDLISKGYMDFKLKYDENGNWIERQEIYNGNVNFLFRREIEYY
jgi:hypothetical protein